MIIKRNTHAPFRLPQILIKPEALRYEVEFTESCRYRFGTDDDADVNKLFGIAFITWGSFWFVIKNLFKGKLKALHHYNSIRWGWRYDALSGIIEILEYCYVNGQRDINHCFYIGFDEKYNMSIIQGLTNENFKHFDFFSRRGLKTYLNDKFSFPNTWLCYELHPYFGGNRTAPHDMEIKMKRL